MYQKRDKILRIYLRNFKVRYYLREVSKLTGLPLRTTQRLLTKLEEEKVMKSERVGKNKYYFLNLGNIRTKLHILISEISKTIDFLSRYKVFNLFLKEKINACLIVFGSFAEFKPEKTSDLDLLIIGDKNLPYHLLPYKVHKINLTEKQFEKALMKKEPLMKEILKKHIILTKHSYFVDKLWDYYEKT